MTLEKHRDEFSVILLHQEPTILELRWLETSAGVTANFKHASGERVAGWRDEHIVPRYNSAGLTKFAFLLPSGAPGTVESGTEPAPETPGRFPTGYFAERQRVLDWFRE